MAGQYGSRKSQDSKKSILGWLFVLPYLVVFISYVLVPIVRGIYISLFKWTMGRAKVFIGIRNYPVLFDDSSFWEALNNTFIFVVISVPVIMAWGLILALIINSNIKAKTFVRSVYFMPYVLSVSVISSIWLFIFQPYTGLLNGILHSLGVKTEIFWLDKSALAWISILIATTWWTVGFNMILFLVGLQNISAEYYEAASIDGAEPWQQFRYITIPGLKRTILSVTLLQTIASFKIFSQSYLMTKGGPGTSTRTLVQYIYETGFRNRELGMAASMAYILFFIMIIISLLQSKLLSIQDD
jgi:multiple sugar transport system permease protein